MTIDPASFAAQGKPTLEQAMAVFEQEGGKGKCSARHLEAVLRGRGFDISYRTLARWIEFGEPGTRALANRQKVKGVKKAVAAALLTVPPEQRSAADDMREHGIESAINEEIALGKTAGARSQDAVQDEVRVIDERIKELVLKSEGELDVIEQKQRKILNIILTEAAQRRAHVMVLIPKDTAAFVDAMTTASKQTLTGGLDQTPKAGDPKTIDAEPVEVEESTPLAAAIGRFLQSEGMQ